MRVHQKLSILFFLETSRPNKEGLLPITVRITIDGKRAEFSLGKQVLADHWDQKTQRVISKGNRNSSWARDLNSTIIHCHAKLEKDFDVLAKAYQYVTAGMLKEVYQGKPQKDQPIATTRERTLCGVCNFKYSKFAALVKSGDRSKNTLKRWRCTKRKLREFLHFKFKKWDVSLSAIKFSHGKDFLHFLQTRQQIDANTAYKYLKNTKELLQIAEDQEWISKSPWSNLKITYQQPERESLSMEDIIRLYHKPMVERLDHVRNIFLFACFTGYAYQEVLDLTKDDVFVGADGKRWIKIDRQKTGNPECIPLLPIPAGIVDRYATDRYCMIHNKLLPVKSYHNYNGYLKEVASICELRLELSTHIARHTFATTICLDNDVPIETVSRMLGHTNIRTTQIYAKVSRKKISSNMADLERKLFTPAGELRSGQS